MSAEPLNPINQFSFFDPIHNIEQDHLERYKFAYRLLKRVSSSDCSPSVGLYGGWGVGKTSILNLIMIVNDQEAVPVSEKPLFEYIDVWPYEISGDLTLPLLIRVRQLAGPLSTGSYSKSWRRIVGVLAQAGTDIALRKILNLELSDVKDYVANLRDVSPDKMNLRDFETLVDDIRGAQDAFCELIHVATTAHQGRKIVFLVDNLDRCSPENVVRLLESIKNFLHAPNCVWIFAMDAGVIASYVDKKYDGTHMDGNSYLDKIIPEQYHIPPISKNSSAKLQQFLSMARPVEHINMPIIDLEKIPSLPDVLVPRRLLKTAHKFYEAYTLDTQPVAAIPPDLIFSTILLYNTWPAFYERLTSGALDHVRGILANFVPEDRRTCKPTLLHQRFQEDRDLTYYIDFCFLHEKRFDDVCKSIATSIEWLREVGLP